MSQQPPVPPPPDEPPPGRPPEGQPPEDTPPKRRYRGGVVTGFTILTAIVALILTMVVHAPAYGRVSAGGIWLTAAVLGVLLVGGLFLDVRSKTPGLRSIGLGVTLGSGIGLAMTGLCVVPLTSF